MVLELQRARTLGRKVMCIMDYLVMLYLLLNMMYVLLVTVYTIISSIHENKKQ